MHTISVDFPSSQQSQPPRVVVCGQQSACDTATINNLARYAFGEAWNGELAVILPARNETDRGFQTICCAEWGERSKADGAWYTQERRGRVLAMPTADCATVVGWQPLTKRICLVHAGRPALTPHDTCQCQTVLSRMANTFGYRTGQTIDDVLFAVTPCISARHFPHHFHAKARALIDPFRPLHEACPEYQTLSADDRDALDLRAMIRLQLERWYQVPPAHIQTHGACTVTHPSLSSRRGGDSTNNLTLVLF